MISSPTPITDNYFLFCHHIFRVKPIVSRLTNWVLLRSMFRRITFILFLIGQVIWAQTEDRDFEKELNYQSKAVQNLKNEIESTRKRHFQFEI